PSSPAPDTLPLHDALPILPEEEMREVADAINAYGADEVIGFHKLRARRAGSRRYVDLHVQFRRGTSLERAHAVSHELQAAIRGRSEEHTFELQSRSDLVCR